MATSVIFVVAALVAPSTADLYAASERPALAVELHSPSTNLRAKLPSNISAHKQRPVELYNASPIHPDTSTSSHSDQLMASIQVAKLPFKRNWAHLPVGPSKFFIEVGANSRNLYRDELGTRLDDGGFLVTFEPLVDKYAKIMTGFGGEADSFRPLGLQHKRGIVLPFAVGCAGSADFNVAPVDGCSSLYEMNPDFDGEGWPAWVKESCSKLQEKRNVPCISLETVVSEWLEGREIAGLKVDAQGFDLNVVKSLGAQVSKVAEIIIEVQTTKGTPLYAGQPLCAEVVSEMGKLGLMVKDSSPEAHVEELCDTLGTEGDLVFVQRRVAPRASDRQLRPVELHNASPIHQDTSTSSHSDQLMASIQVAKLPFKRNWAHLPVGPSKFFIEVGANSRNLYRDELGTRLDDGGFLVTFEPLLDKYAKIMTGFGGEADSFRPLGLQHKRGIVLPFAVGCAGSADFNVAPVDGCSSLYEMNPDFDGEGWPAWVKESCSKLQEKRNVPCISLETVVSEWLEGREIAGLKVDAQGFDLNVVKSLGAQVSKVAEIIIEVQTTKGTPLYAGQPLCAEVVSEMGKLGLMVKDSSPEAHVEELCDTLGTEGDLVFVQRKGAQRVATEGKFRSSTPKYKGKGVRKVRIGLVLIFITALFVVCSWRVKVGMAQK